MDLARVTLPDDVAIQDSFELSVVPRKMPGAHLKNLCFQFSYFFVAPCCNTHAFRSDIGIHIADKMYAVGIGVEEALVALLA